MNEKARLRMNRLSHLMVAAGMLIAAACKKTTPPPPTQTSATTDALSMPAIRTPESDARVKADRAAAMERILDKRYAGDPAGKVAMRNTMSQLDAKLDAEDKLAEIHRRTMVTPAPADFKPEPVARKVRLRLALEKTKIRVGEKLRFRLEMTNVGRDPLDYHEIRSSLFAGNLLDTVTMSFYLTDSRNKRVELMPRTGRPSDGGAPSEKLVPPRGLPAAELEKWFQETNAMGQAHATFKVMLLPGETLRSIGEDDSSVENFKALIVEEDAYDKPGPYRLHLELDDRPDPLDDDYIQFSLKTGDTLEEIHKRHDRRNKEALGPISSNAVAFEVVR